METIFGFLLVGGFFGGTLGAFLGAAIGKINEESDKKTEGRGMIGFIMGVIGGGLLALMIAGSMQ